MRTGIRGPRCRLVVWIAFVALVPWTFSRADDPFDPQFDAVTLDLGGKTLSPIRIRKPWGPSYRVGNRTVVVRDTVVEDGDSKDGRPAWSVPSKDPRKLRFLGAMGEVALLRSAPVPEEAQRRPEILRFDVATHKWLEPLVIPAEKKDDPAEVLGTLIADDKRLVVLLLQVKSQKEREGAVVGHRLLLFKQGQVQPVWSRSLPAEGERPEPGVGLFAPVVPDYASSAVQYLSWLDNDILLCTGEKDDVMLVESATGKTSWRLPRVWEFQRGFVGPSVWSHYIARFGKQIHRADLFAPGTPEYDKALAEEEKERAPDRAAFDKQFQCAIVGGPLVVEVPIKDREGKPAVGKVLYVAVAKAPNQWNHGYLSDCIVYEVSLGGEVVGMANLPRMVHGSQHATVPGGLVWGCEKGAMVMLAPETDGTGFFGMPGGPDMLARVAWYRQFPKPELKGWLTADKVRDVVAFDSTHAYRAVAGGYVARKEEKIYRFPLSVVDLASGVERSATLAVPYKGELKLPTQNIDGSADSTHARGPYLLGVTQLYVDRNSLEVTIGMEGTSAGVTFDLKAAGLAE